MLKFSYVLSFFILIIFCFSCGKSPKEKFKGMWGEDFNPKILIYEQSEDELLVFSDWDDIGEGTFRANVSENKLSYGIKTRIGELMVEMVFNDQTDLLSVSTFNNEIVEFQKYSIKSLDEALGTWTLKFKDINKPDTLIVNKEGEFYLFKRINHNRNGRKYLAENKYFIKNGAMIERNGQSKDLLFQKGDALKYIEIKKDTLILSKNAKYTK